MKKNLAQQWIAFIDDLQLLKPKDRMQRLLAMEASDLSTALQRIIPSLEEAPVIQGPFSPFELWLPYPSEAVLRQIPAYSLVFEKIYTIDPVFDVFTVYEAILSESQSQTPPNLPTAGPFYQDEFLGKLLRAADSAESQVMVVMAQREKIAAARQLSNVIDFLVQNIDLIDEDVWILSPGGKVPVSDLSIFIKSLLSRFMSNHREEFERLHREFAARKDKKKLEADIVSLLSDSLSLIFFWELEVDFLNSLFLKTSLPSNIAPSISIGGQRTQKIISAIVGLAGDLLSDSICVHGGIHWPSPEHEIAIRSLDGIPSQELLAVRHKEKEALASFRYKMQERLLDLKATVGTEQYRQLIQKQQAEDNAQFAEIELIVNRIRRDCLRKITCEISFVTLAAAGAILSAAASVYDPVALAGVGLGAAGLVSAASKIMETWIDYKSKLEELREKDAYILWRLQSS